MKEVSAPDSLDALRTILIETGRIKNTDRLTHLTGGVSSLVARIDGAESDPWVVKAPLAQLAVADEWIVDRSRGMNEAAALRCLNGHIGPARVPRLLFFDGDFTISGQEMIAGPPPTYKDELMQGQSRPEVATALGSALGALHRLSPPPELAGPEPRRLFDDLRLDPYYRVTAVRQPELGPLLQSLIDETVTVTPRCLVHGDFTPKNVLVSTDEVVIVDWEVIHTGDGSFDLATMTAHLLLKSLRDGAMGDRTSVLASVSKLWAAYDGPACRQRALRHTGAVMLARIYGKSQVEYLASTAARERVHAVGRRALEGGCGDIEDLIEVARLASQSKE
ncbi:MAG TPA: phosphotransferase [Acidimicrobiales bacterium]|jgi:5-methylthioribose kinase